MTYKIRKSAIVGTDFEVRVAAHAREMRDWRDQMARVKAQAGDPKIAQIDRWVARPAPTEHQHVMSAVNEIGNADFEIVDDGPTPAQILVAKKRMLFAAVNQAEAAANNEVIPEGKRRLRNLREATIRRDDNSRAADIISKSGGFLAMIGISSKIKPEDMAAEIEKARPAEDTQLLRSQDDVRSSFVKIELVAAQMHSDIEDLTLDNIDAWKMPDFPK